MRRVKIRLPRNLFLRDAIIMPRCKKRLICHSLALVLDVCFRQAGHLQYLSIKIRVICLFTSYHSFDHHVERLMRQMWIQMATQRIV